MTIWIQILLAVLPALIKFLVELFDKKEKLSIMQQKKLNWILHRCKELETAAVYVGCVRGGWQPPVQAEEENGA